MTLGPFVLSLPRLFLLLGLSAALLVAYLLERRDGLSVDRPLWWSLLAGVLVARLDFVATHLSDYAQAPWEALYVWQDGYEPLAGVAAAAAVAVWFGWRRRYPPGRLAAPLLTALLVWGGLSGLQQALHQGLERPLPALEVTDLGGEPVSLDAFRGRPVVLNLWASWCPPCRREMPALAAAQARHEAATFLFLNQGEGPEVIRQYLAGEGLGLRNVLLDVHGRVGRHFDAPGLPTTLFFDADGRLVRVHMGELSRARLGDYLKELGLR